MARFYITTPIYYVNDKPHVGHAYTTVAADVLARWNRMNGRPVTFLTGTDEHGQKVMEAAAKRGISPMEHVDSMAPAFQALWTRLNISHDDFIRTTQPRHTLVVQRILQRLFDQGDIYEDAYEGWYSTAAERFWTEKDLVDGKCPDTGQPVEWVRERNYFFRMGKYADQLRTWIDTHPGFLRPENRRNEVLGYLRKDVGDLCISRTKARMSWGIELPFDKDFVTYVWFDALSNYISAVGYTTDEARFEEHWPADVHLMGKDILTTHSVYWSTMLFALGLEPADIIYAHGWWTVEGQKMSKSLGNAVDPHLLIDCYGTDPLRYFLMREIPFGLDGEPAVLEGARGALGAGARRQQVHRHAGALEAQPRGSDRAPGRRDAPQPGAVPRDRHPPGARRTGKNGGARPKAGPRHARPVRARPAGRPHPGRDGGRGRSALPAPPGAA